MLLGPHDTVFDMVLSLINVYVIETNIFFFLVDSPKFFSLGY